MPTENAECRWRVTSVFKQKLYGSEREKLYGRTTLSTAAFLFKITSLAPFSHGHKDNKNNILLLFNHPFNQVLVHWLGTQTRTCCTPKVLIQGIFKTWVCTLHTNRFWEMWLNGISIAGKGGERNSNIIIIEKGHNQSSLLGRVSMKWIKLSYYFLITNRNL